MEWRVVAWNASKIGKRLGAVLLVGAVLALVGCGADETSDRPSASGMARGVLTGVTFEQAQSRLLSVCYNTGLVILDATRRRVVCGIPVATLAEELEKVMDVPIYTRGLEVAAYAGDTYRFLQFNIKEEEDSIKITALQWLESKDSDGNIERLFLTSPQEAARLREALISIGAQLL